MPIGDLLIVFSKNLVKSGLLNEDPEHQDVGPICEEDI
jgi:hypothetical protein